MLKASDVVDDLLRISDRISTQVRLISVGALALVWGLLVAPGSMVEIAPPALLSIGLLALFTMAVDLLQYIAGYLNSARQLRRIEPADEGPPYNRRAGLYRLRTWCFWAKQVMALGTVVGLALVLIPALLTRAP